MFLKLIYFCILAALCRIHVHGNLYDPHEFPELGPFVEGWYIRLVDIVAKRSFGVLLGSTLPENPQRAENLAFVGLLHGEPGQKLRSYTNLPPVESFNVTVRGGQPVTTDPTMSAPVDFSVSVPTVGRLTVGPNLTQISLTVDSIHVQATIGTPVVWGPEGQGPEGWVYQLGHLMEVNWFVYSLRSRVLEYRVTDLEVGTVWSGTTGFAHMEKNWGTSFPKAWVWAQGISDTDHEITFALSYGVLEILRMDIQAHLFGYRNPTKGIVINMAPYNSVLTVETNNGCSGEVDVTMTGWTHRVRLTVSAPSHTFSDCLLCPERNGFRRASKESFVASAQVVVSRRRSLIYFTEIDRQEIRGLAALEFGGDYLCGGSCD